MAGYTYTDFINAVSSVLESPITNAAAAAPFVNALYNLWLPRAIEAAEQRIYRELDLMGTHIIDDYPFGLTPNTRQFTLPEDLGTFVVVTQISVTYPIGSGTRNQLLPVSKEYLDAAWPNDTTPFTPAYPVCWCPFDQASIFIGPAPDAGYEIEITGTVRPNPLSSTNTTTILTTYLPDLFLAAALVSFIGFQRDYGQASDDPKLAVSWEGNYQTAFHSAAVEQARVRFASQGWGSRIPSPVASPPQT